MFGHSFEPAPGSPAAPALTGKHIAAYAAALLLGVTLTGYAVHEHNQAQNLAAAKDQTTATLNETRHELTDLSARVNVLLARADVAAQQNAQAQPPALPHLAAHPAISHPRKDDPRYKKLQAQLDAQGKAIEDTRSQLTSTQGDLVSTRTELSGSIAHTHDELVVLQKKGERNYVEFDISKSKEFQHNGPFGIRLKKANVKHHYADLELIVDDRNLSQKHINLYQPVMFYTPDSPQAAEVVINDIGKDHIHGYVSAPKYKQSELASMSNPQDGSTPAAQPAPRKRLTVAQ